MSGHDRLARFVSAAAAAYAAQVTDPLARTSTEAIFETLRAPLAPRARPGSRIGACAHLDSAIAPLLVAGQGVLFDLAEAFQALEPDLEWYRRTDRYPGETLGANAAFPDGHANAAIIGPGGLAPHPSVWMGVSLLAPHVRYPDHRHPPEETYLVLSDGAFYQEGRGWFTPGVGGTFYNRPDIVHAMRSGAAPLFALWALRRV